MPGTTREYGKENKENIPPNTNHYQNEFNQNQIKAPKSILKKSPEEIQKRLNEQECEIDRIKNIIMTSGIKDTKSIEMKLRSLEDRIQRMRINKSSDTSEVNQISNLLFNISDEVNYLRSCKMIIEKEHKQRSSNIPFHSPRSPYENLSKPPLMFPPPPNSRSPSPSVMVRTHICVLPHSQETYPHPPHYPIETPYIPAPTQVIPSIPLASLPAETPYIYHQSENLPVQTQLEVLNPIPFHSLPPPQTPELPSAMNIGNKLIPQSMPHTPQINQQHAPISSLQFGPSVNCAPQSPPVTTTPYPPLVPLPQTVPLNTYSSTIQTHHTETISREMQSDIQKCLSQLQYNFQEPISIQTTSMALPTSSITNLSPTVAPPHLSIPTPFITQPLQNSSIINNASFNKECPLPPAQIEDLPPPPAHHVNSQFTTSSNVQDLESSVDLIVSDTSLTSFTDISIHMYEESTSCKHTTAISTDTHDLVKYWPSIEMDPAQKEAAIKEQMYIALAKAEAEIKAELQTKAKLCPIPSQISGGQPSPRFWSLSSGGGAFNAPSQNIKDLSILSPSSFPPSKKPSTIETKPSSTAINPDTIKEEYESPICSSDELETPKAHNNTKSKKKKITKSKENKPKQNIKAAVHKVPTSRNELNKNESKTRLPRSSSMDKSKPQIRKQHRSLSPTKQTMKEKSTETVEIQTQISVRGSTPPPEPSQWTSAAWQAMSPPSKPKLTTPLHILHNSTNTLGR